MNNQLRAAELLQQAAAALTNSGTSGDPPQDKPTHHCISSSITAQLSAQEANHQKQRWTHRFYVLSSTTQVSMENLCSQGIKFFQCVNWSKDF